MFQSYYEFHTDVFPDTYLFTTKISKNEWLEGQNGSLSKVQLNPSTQKVYNPSLNGLSDVAKQASNNSNTPVAAPTVVTTPTETVKPSSRQVEKKDEPPKTPSPEPVAAQVILNSVKNGNHHQNESNGSQPNGKTHDEPRKTPSPTNGDSSANDSSEPKRETFVRPVSPPKVQLRQKDPNSQQQSTTTPRAKAKSGISLALIPNFLEA